MGHRGIRSFPVFKNVVPLKDYLEQLVRSFDLKARHFPFTDSSIR